MCLSMVTSSLTCTARDCLNNNGWCHRFVIVTSIVVIRRKSKYGFLVARVLKKYKRDNDFILVQAIEALCPAVR